MAISKECISLAAEFAVASELCRRGIYTQLTFGNRKRTDLLIMAGNNNVIRIEVKAKQAREWPNCKGVFGENVFLVLVDYADCDETKRPDFYILTPEHWLKLIKKEIQKYNDKHPERRVEIDSENVPVFLDEVNRYGKPYRGMGIRPERIQEYKEAWCKISDKVQTS